MGKIIRRRKYREATSGRNYVMKYIGSALLAGSGALMGSTEDHIFEVMLLGTGIGVRYMSKWGRKKTSYYASEIFKTAVLFGAGYAMTHPEEVSNAVHYIKSFF